MFPNTVILLVILHMSAVAPATAFYIPLSTSIQSSVSPAASCSPSYVQTASAQEGRFHKAHICIPAKQRGHGLGVHMGARLKCHTVALAKCPALNRGILPPGGFDMEKPQVPSDTGRIHVPPTPAPSDARS